MKLSRYANSLCKTIFILGSIAGMSNNAFAAHFGNDGRDGFDGMDGQRGDDGNTETINLINSGGHYRIELRGEDGGDGRNGGDGEHASQCNHERVEDDLFGANGGDAGRGGNGGRGGDGGDVTIYYRDLNQLDMVSIIAPGGEGGRPGISGRPGEGCECRDHFWEIRKRCDSNNDGKHDEVCVEKFNCEDGNDGLERLNGSHGERGRNGIVTLIRRNKTLTKDQPAQTHQIASSMFREFEVNRHFWQYRNGMSSLLAPGSIVEDRFREYTHTESAQYRFNWNERRSFNQFNLNAEVELEENKNITVRFNGNALAASRVSKVDGVNVINIDKVFFASELQDFKIGKIEGRGDKTVLKIIDQKNLGQVGKFSIRLTLKAKNILGIFKSKVIKEVIVPKNLIRQTSGYVEIKIGEMVKKAEKEFKKEGKKYWIDLNLSRNWNGQSVSKSFEDIERTLN